MYLAKTKSGEIRIQIFDKADPHCGTIPRSTQSTSSPSPSTTKELVVYYQPIVDLWTRQRVGVEALVRWQHPKGVFSPRCLLGSRRADRPHRPDRFVGASPPRATGPSLELRADAEHQLSLSVNFRPDSSTEPDLVDEVSSVLVEAGISPRRLRLVLDLTDSLLPIDEDEARTHVRQLHRMGVVLAIDDFGTGYSSLQYMRELPIGVVKIDHSFISAIGRSSRDEAIIRSIVELAHTLGLTVTAEGIETECAARVHVRDRMRHGAGISLRQT